MPAVFDYTDFRQYLLDFYRERKRKKPSFSFQYWANSAGFKAKSFVKDVIDGRKNLSNASIEKLQKVLEINGKAFSYFCDLVAFNQSKTMGVRNHYYAKLLSYNKRNYAKLILADQFEFYSQWYHNTVRELVCLVDFNEDYRLLAKMVEPAITARQARQSVQLLLRLGLVKKIGKKYGQVERIITTGVEVKAMATANFHKQNLAVALRAIEHFSKEDKDISCVILGLSAAGLEAVKSEVQQFRKKLLKIAEMDKDLERVYHVSFQLYPTSKRKA